MSKISMGLFSKLFATKIARVEAGLLSILLVIISALFAVLFSFAALATRIGARLHHTASGFAMVAAIFFLFFFS